MPGALNQAKLGRFFTGAQTWFNQGFKGAKPEFERFAIKVNSKTRTEDYGWLGDFPDFEEWIGSRTYKNLKAYNYSIVNKKWQTAVKIKREDVADDMLGLFDQKMMSMGRRARVFPDRLCFQQLMAAFTGLCYDGQPLCDADHDMAGASFSNLLTNVTAPDATGAPGEPWFLIHTGEPAAMPIIYQEREAPEMTAVVGLDDSEVFDTDEYKFGARIRANAGFGLWQTIFGCTCSLTENNFNYAYQQMLKVTSDTGRKLDLKPDLLICGPDNRASSNEVVKVERLASGASNPNWKAVDVLVTSYLAIN